jgi:hypothetical protein
MEYWNSGIMGYNKKIKNCPLTLPLSPLGRGWSEGNYGIRIWKKRM